MPYIVEKMEEQLVDAIAKPEGWVARDPFYKSFYDSIGLLRNSHQEQGTTLKTPEWKLVARLQTTLDDANRLINADFIRDKRLFYSWLDRNPSYCTYDRRRGRRM